RGFARRELRYVKLQQPAVEETQPPLQPCPGRWRAIGGLAEHDRQQVGDGAVLDPERAVHVGFAELDLGVEEHAALGGPGGEMDRDAGRAAIADGESPPARRGEPEGPAAYESLQQTSQQPVHRPHPPVSSCPYLAYAFPRGRVPSIRRKNRRRDVLLEQNQTVRAIAGTTHP